MREHTFSKMNSEQIREYFQGEFEKYYKAARRAYSLMERNEDNPIIKMLATHLWLSFKSKMDAAHKYEWLYN